MALQAGGPVGLGEDGVLSFHEHDTRGLPERLLRASSVLVLCARVFFGKINTNLFCVPSHTGAAHPAAKCIGAVLSLATTLDGDLGDSEVETESGFALTVGWWWQWTTRGVGVLSSKTRWPSTVSPARCESVGKRNASAVSGSVQARTLAACVCVRACMRASDLTAEQKCGG